MVVTGRSTGRSVLVTGAGSGIGRATVRLFASGGAHALAVDLGEGAEITAANYDGISAMRGDAGSETDVAAMVATAVERHGGLDIIHANAGISGGMAGLFDQRAEGWEALLRVNLIGPFLTIKYGARAMLDAGRPGAIVCTASVAGLRAGAGGPAYSASKAVIINLVQSAAQQLTGTGVRINAVCLGLIETCMTQGLYDLARPKGHEDMVGQLNPLKRGGEPEEIARAVTFLASDEASYVNGQALVVDGGLSISHRFAKPQMLDETTF